MIISNTNYSLDIINIGGEFTTVLLIISLIISVLLAYTKYWNRYNSNIIDMCSHPMLIIFIETVIFKIMLIIYLKQI